MFAPTIGWPLVVCWSFRLFFVPKPQFLTDGVARYFSTTIPNSYAATGIRTHVSRVAPDWDLSDALPTEL